MGAISLPFNVQTGDPLDPDPLMANDQTIVSAVNGGLEMGSNVKAAAPSASITGKDNTAGISTSGLRADAQFVIQGIENVTALPTTGNRLGRMVYVTAGGDIGKAFICTEASIPTWKAFANQAATDVAVHGAQHKDSGDDPLADNTISDHMFAAKGTIFEATLGSDHLNISGSGWSDIVDLTTVTTSGLQTLGIWVNLRFQNSDSGTGHNAAFRVRDVTNSNTTIYRSDGIEVSNISGNSVQTQISGFFYYTTPATGLRTLRVQAGTTIANKVDVLASTSFNSETVKPATIQAVIL